MAKDWDEFKAKLDEALPSFMEAVLSICPACGLREADDEDTGWCSRCAGVAVTESYQQRKVNERRERWLSWLAMRRTA